MRPASRCAGGSGFSVGCRCAWYVEGVEDRQHARVVAVRVVVGGDWAKCGSSRRCRARRAAGTRSPAGRLERRDRVLGRRAAEPLQLRHCWIGRSRRWRARLADDRAEVLERRRRRRSAAARSSRKNSAASWRPASRRRSSWSGRRARRAGRRTSCCPGAACGKTASAWASDSFSAAIAPHQRRSVRRPAR